MSQSIFNRRVKDRHSCQIKLLCFPWAGGGSNYYAELNKIFPPSVEVVGVCYPGKESRYHELPFTSINHLINEVLAGVHKEFSPGVSLALFGHSFGAFMAFETCRRLAGQHREPIHLFLSGMHAPYSAGRRDRVLWVSKMDDSNFKNHLKELGGTPPEILDDATFMEVLEPAIRSDYRLLESYDFHWNPSSDKPPLTCPMTFFDGEEDFDHTPSEWRPLTTGTFDMHKFPGKHFWLTSSENQEKMTKTIMNGLSS